MRTIFITGTDTGVGKTVLTGLLLAYLRHCGAKALALKPFSSGSRTDAQLLHALQGGDLTLDEINPFHYSRPLAPFTAARGQRGIVQIESVLSQIERVAPRCDCLLIEGIGGLLVPLGDGYTVRDLIHRLNCAVFIVSRNQIGTINHTLLTVEALQVTGTLSSRPMALARLRQCMHTARISNAGHDSRPTVRSLGLKVVLVDQPEPDVSSRSNAHALAKLLAPVPLFRMPFLGLRCRAARQVEQHAQRLRPLLARLLSE